MSAIWDWLKAEWEWIKFDTREVNKLKDRVKALEDWRKELDGRLEALAKHIGMKTDNLRTAEDDAGKVTKP